MMTQEQKTVWIVETYDYELDELVTDVCYDSKEAMSLYDAYKSECDLINVRRGDTVTQFEVDWFHPQQH
jgi:hypothetical protein